MNQFTVSGEVDSDLKDATIPNLNLRVVSFRIKCSEKAYKGGTKESWHDVNFFGEDAMTVLAQKPTKGSKVLVTGKIGTRKVKANEKEFGVSSLTGRECFVLKTEETAPATPDWDSDIPA